LRPVLAGEADEEVPPEVEEALVVDADEGVAVLVAVLVVAVVAVEAVLLVNGEVDVLGVDEPPPTYSTFVGTDAATWTVVVGV
jgi:hypothetical protein